MDLQGLPKVGTVDERFQSYNIEMAAVTGADFWKPYGSAPAATPAPPGAPAGMGPDLLEYRPPRDLANPRLRTLAAALGPAYVRVSGTWANSTYFADTDHPPATPPEGFKGVLTRDQWRGVVDFANATDARIVSSFAISPGTRDADGQWTPEQAQRWLDYTRSVGGEIAAAEFMNEPNAAAMGGAPEGYDAAAYGRDFQAFKAFIDKADPNMTILGPGSVGEAPTGFGSGTENLGELLGAAGAISSADMLAAAGPGVDGFSYRHYNAGSQRCASMGLPLTNPGEALSADFLNRTGETRAYYAGLRDRFEPGKPMWLTEVADAACGGNPWAGTFLDSFRYADQLGLLAREGVQVVMHNTLESSDYSLLDENDLTPKPTYWTALLWHRLMGSTVLDPGVPADNGLRVYAHCQPDTPGGVTLLAINTDRDHRHTLTLPDQAQRYTLTADPLDSKTVKLNGTVLELGPGDSLPELTGTPTEAGQIDLDPATITFLTTPGAGHTACE
ncbi:hypothetical protein GCM10009632_55560 [Mycolicibacterium alvei]